MLFEGMTGEDYEQVVCEGNQSKENQWSNHHPVNKEKGVAFTTAQLL